MVLYRATRSYWVNLKSISPLYKLRSPRGVLFILFFLFCIPFSWAQKHSQKELEYRKLMFLFAADNFNQAYQRFKYSQQIAEYRRKKANSIMETQGEITKKIDELNRRKDDKKQLLTSEEQEKYDLAKEKTEQEGN